MNIKVYNIDSIRNIKIREIAKNLLSDKQLTPPQYEAVETAFPVSFKQTNIFVAIGLFLFTGLCVLFGCGLFALLFSNAFNNDAFWGSMCLFYALILAVVNEFFIRENHWYRSGSDNALLYTAIGFFVAGIVVMTKIDIAEATYFFFIFVVLSLATWRYGDPLLALATFGTLLIWLLTVCKNTGLGMAMIPLSLAGTSFAMYIFSKKNKDNDAFLYWEDCLKLLEFASLFTLYAAINYYVIQHFAIELDSRFETEPLPLGIVFGALTALLPTIYIAIGIKNRDRILWIVGSLCLIATVMTYRHYHSVLPPEWALTGAGIVFLALGLFLMRYFEIPKYGFVYQPERAKDNPLETLLMNQLLQQTHNTGTVHDTPPQYGGGDFDGGGAGGTF